jgi:hypothetical protein
MKQTINIEKFELIDQLSNAIQQTKDKKLKNDIAYAIHQIIEAQEVSETEYDLVLNYKIKANKHLFYPYI